MPGTVVPTVATCEAVSTADGMEATEEVGVFSAPAALDAQSGRLVVVSAFRGLGMTARTASLDVCSNTWTFHKDAPWTQVSWGGPAVLYDPGTDSILALTVSETRPTEVRRYSSATHQWAETTLPQKLLPWAYSVDLDQWSLLPTIEFPPGFESSALTHAALDPTSGQVLFLMEAAGSRTLWSYSPAWRTLERLRGQVPAGRSGDPTLILDAAARRLVLVLWGSPFEALGETWTFDLLSQNWTNQHAVPPELPYKEPARSLVEARREATFDPDSRRTFVLMNGQLASYQTGADQWDAVPPGHGWPSKVRLAETQDGGLAGPLARTGHAMVYDPVNTRILVFGGTWQTTKGEEKRGDIWAYDVPTNTWTELVPPTTPELSSD
jgi:hypothetical protein